MNNSPTSPIDQYIQTFPKNVQVLLQQMRQTIKDVAPDAEETIKYRMPTFVFHGNLVHFAAPPDSENRTISGRRK